MRMKLGIASLVVGMAAVSFGQQYKVYDIGAELGAESSIAYGVNDSGQVVGGAFVNGIQRAFIWDKINGAQFLGDLPGGVEASTAYKINNSGVVVGNSSSSLSGAEMFTWDSISGMQGHGIPVGEIGMFGLAINDSGVVAGGFSNTYTWDSTNGYTNLNISPGLGSRARGINNSGQVAGYSGSPEQAYFYDPINGVQFLGDFAGGLNRSVGAALNDNGVVVGEATNEVGRRAFMWDSVNGMVDLGALDPTFQESFALAVNNAGQVTGYSANLEDSIFLWDSVNGMRDLSTLIIDNPNNLIMGEGYGINSSGSIVGWGAFQSGQKAIYVEAVPEPGTIAVLAGIGMIAARRRKK